ncbi:divergent polysaccharide deacetylase family protein [Pelagibius sp. CAU 1746]|uniref:divergent polysaccharide deacetylase family protein n=1 Tax=Pelagibius sp. CAU 1746 TaxID=3140370 RepID=UPI00325BF4C6
MDSFLANRGLLLTAWFVVLAALGGALALALLQPPPAPRTEPVILALPGAGGAGAPDSEEAAARQAGAEAPLPAPGPEHSPAPSPEAGPETTAETTGEAAGETPPEAGSPPVPPPAAKAAAPEDEPREAPETAPEQAPAAAAAPPRPEPAAPAETAPAEAPAAKDQAGPPAGTADGGQPPKTESAQAESAQAAPAAAEPAPENPAPESPAPESPAAGSSSSGKASTEEAEAGEPDSGQVAAIPVIPPAPEQLPYWERYRQPFNMADERPRIAVVLTGLGISDGATETAINRLPPAVTLSFSPYTRGLERWIALARSRGHEVMIDLPMEPATFPNEDPGPQGLLVKLSAEENLDRLDWVLSRGSAYVGVAGALGSRFTASRSAMEPILQDVKARGLIFLDRRTTQDSVVPELAREIGLPRAINNRSVDERQASRVAIDARLAQIERIALSEGYAVAMAQPYPVTLERLAEWATELTARGYVIAPISALADQQKTF